MSTALAPGVPLSGVVDARTQAFSVLTAAQINRVRSCGTLQKVQAGEIVFEPGDTEVPFFDLPCSSMEVVLVHRALAEL